MNQHLVGRVCSGLLVVLAGCGPASGLMPSGRVVADARSVGDFTAVKVVGPFRLTAAPGPLRVTVTADDNLLPAIETVVEAGQLVVRTRPNTNLLGFTALDVEVHAAQLDGAWLGSTARGEATLTSGVPVSLHAEASSHLVVTGLSAPRASVDASGSSTVQLRGVVPALDAVVKSASQLEAAEVRADVVSLDVREASSVWANASGKVSGQVSGSSHVVVRGPAVLELDVTTASTVARE